MSYTNHELQQIFRKTNGYCYYCGRTLSFDKYGLYVDNMGWEVDHALPLSRGGNNMIDNLYAACIPCNRIKSDYTDSEFKIWVKDNFTSWIKFREWSMNKVYN